MCCCSRSWWCGSPGGGRGLPGGGRGLTGDEHGLPDAACDTVVCCVSD